VPAGYDTVWFLSDYGLEDEFAGVVKAVIHGIAPRVTVIDLTHQVPAHDVRAGSLVLARAIQYLPGGVVLAVVDPGVGTSRRAVAVEVHGDPDDDAEGGDGRAPGEGGGAPAVLVGPDNGLLAAAVAMAGGARRAVSLTRSEYHLPAPGATFAGRDVFAPVTAHLCAGVDLADLGEPVDPLSLLPGLLPLSRWEDGKVVGEVLWIDRFGNAQLNLGPDEVEAFGDRIVLRRGDQARVVSRVATFDQLAGSQLGLVVDSYGLLAVAAYQRSAAEELRLRAGDAVTLEAPSE
jgi:S-adenosylmethionine hydrolase